MTTSRHNKLTELSYNALADLVIHRENQLDKANKTIGTYESKKLSMNKYNAWKKKNRKNNMIEIEKLQLEIRNLNIKIDEYDELNTVNAEQHMKLLAKYAAVLETMLKQAGVELPKITNGKTYE